jgi:hypothetical protein
MIYIREQDIPTQERHMVPFQLPKIEQRRRQRITDRKSRRKCKHTSTARQSARSTA